MLASIRHAASAVFGRRSASAIDEPPSSSWVSRMIRSAASGSVVNSLQQLEDPRQIGPDPVGVELPSRKVGLVADGRAQQLAPAA